MSDQPSITILAGSHLIDDDRDGYRVEVQHVALRNALDEFRRLDGFSRRLCIEVDHVGRFERFLRPELPARHRKRPRLDMLRPEILRIFTSQLDPRSPELSMVEVITEGQCRMALAEHFRSRTQQVNTSCEFITAEIVRRLGKGARQIEMFLEYNEKRVNRLTIDLGIHQARKVFGVQTPIRYQLIGDSANSLPTASGS